MSTWEGVFFSFRPIGIGSKNVPTLLLLSAPFTLLSLLPRIAQPSQTLRKHTKSRNSFVCHRLAPSKLLEGIVTRGNPSSDVFRSLPFTGWSARRPMRAQ
uniref:Uncharacterized protein n=1 Tax=Chloropicon laureae TaxID=464258 RepID=A0A7S2Z1F0_9CHLO